VLLLTTAIVGCDTEPEADPLAWPGIEREHKPWTRWWWMGSAVDTTTLTTLLEQYREAGLGGVEITPIYGVRGEESRFIDYLSPHWMEMLAHTVAEAERLAMGVDMATGTGWPFGGPHIGVDHAATRALAESYALKTGERLTVSLRKSDEAVGRQAPLQTLMAFSDRGEVLDLTDRVDTAGTLGWTAPAGSWHLVALFQGWTGQQVKRAAPGGAGPVIDHFSRPAFDYYIARFDSAFAGHHPGPIRAFFNDSFEAYGSDWTPDFFDAFEARRGYDLRPHLLALLRVDTVAQDHIGRVTADYQQTMADLLLDAFTRPWAAWAHRHGSLVRNQAHGSPGNLLDLYAAVDIPETETFNPDRFAIPGYRTHPEYRETTDPTNPLVLKFAASAAHLAGKPLVSAETATWLDEHFRVSLSQIKPVVDKLFAAGINHVFYHGTAYSPPDADWPGWLFYAATHVGPTNSFWRDLPALNAYIARCQSFLQSGHPDADVLLYYPVHDTRYRSDRSFFQFTVHNPDAWLFNTPLHEAAQRLLDEGYAFDYVSDRLLRTVRFSEGKLRTEGAAYDVVLVPESRFMPLGTLEHLMRLARDGATILIHRRLPDDVPGLADLADRRARFHLRGSSLAFEPQDAGLQIAPVGRGRFVVGDDLQALLDEASLRRERIVDAGVAFIRRTHPEGHHYFLAHLGAEPLDEWVPLTVGAASAVFFDPMTGQQGVAAVRMGQENTPEIYLQLEPGESLIVRTFAGRRVEGPAWSYLRPAGTPRALTGPWQITFLEGGPTRPAEVTLDTLAAWTTLDGEPYRQFSGTARYTLTFEKPATEAAAWILDLGPVRESARVRLNGRPLGHAFSLPFRLRVDALQNGTNTLEVEVTNLMANRIASLDRRGVTWRRFYDINFVNLHYQPFDASGWPPMESGLPGPVRLIPTETRKP